MIRVLLADDHDVVRQGIAALLSAHEDIEVAGEASDGDAALRWLRDHTADVAVVDAAMPGPGIIRILERVRASDSGCAVLVLSLYPVEQYGVRVLRAGAAGYLTKGVSGGELVEAIRRVAGGSRYISVALAEQLADRLDRPPAEPSHECLSGREFEVLLLVASGLDGGRIAERLGVTPQTVSTYRARIRDKLGLATTAQIVRYAIDNELALPDP